MEDETVAAQPETEVTEEVAQAEAPAAPIETPEQKEAKSRKNRRSAEQRIDQLTAKARELERQLEAERADRATKSEPEDAAPKREDFADYEDYIEARAEHKAAIAANKVLTEAQMRYQQDQEVAQNNARQRAFEEARDQAIDRGAAIYDDFEAVTTDPDLQITSVMADALLSSEKSHELWYHLGKNPDVAEKIAALPPKKQYMAIGRLEEQLVIGKRASNAPKPTEVTTSRGSTSNRLSDDLSVKEWLRRRNAQVHGNH